MHTNSLVKQLLKIHDSAVEGAYFESVNDEEILVIRVRPYSRQMRRCPICGKHCEGYDSGMKMRRWRSLDLGSTRVYLEAYAPRVECAEHGVHTAKVPWAHHHSAFTLDFETAVTWMALHATAKDVAEFFRIKWHSVGSIAQRVQKTLESEQPNRFDGLERIGIDETSYKKGHKYMTVIVNHMDSSLIWAKKGHGKEVLTLFFKELTEEQRASIKFVTADGARWIADCVKDFCPNAERCVDPFHVVGWATDALDEVRRAAVRDAKKLVTEDKTANDSKKKTKFRQTSLRSTLC